MRQVDILIQSRLKTLLKEGVYQTFTPNQTPGEPWPDTAPKHLGKWKGSEAKLQQYLEKIKASKFNVGLVQTGLADHAVYVLNWQNETYWFYHNNEVYSAGGAENGRTMGYDVKTINGEERLNIYKLPNDRGEKTLAGYFVYNGNRLVWNKKVEQSESDADKYAAIRTALDVAGFIPVIGDVADVVNAVWYFYDGEIFEGILSSLAVVPVIGSFIAASGKATLRALKSLNKVDDMGDVALAMVKKMNPTKAEMAQIHEGLGHIYDKIGSSTMLEKTVGSGTIDDILKQIDKARKKLNGADLDKLADISKTQATLGKGLDLATDATSLASRATTNAGVLGKGWINKKIRALSSLTYEASAKETGNLIVKVINGLPAGRKLTGGVSGLFTLGVKPKNAQALVDSMARGFIKNVKRDPDKLLLLLKSSNKLPYNTYEPILKNMNNILDNAQQTLDFDSIRKLSRRIDVTDASGVVQKINPKNLSDADLRSILTSGSVNIKPKRIEKIDPDGMRSLIGNLDPKELDSISESVAKHAIDSDNPFWNSMLSDPQSKLKYWIWPGDLKGVKEQLFANINDVRKWADIVYNEASAALGDTVIDQKFPSLVPDSPRREAIIYPTVKNTVKTYTPNAYGTVKKIIGKDGVVDAATDMFGLPDESKAAYDPTKIQ